MPVWRRTLAAFLAITGVAVAGCTQAGRDESAPVGELTIPGRFSLRAGATATLLPVTAIDSAAGRIRYGDAVIEYDHGPYSDPFEPIAGDEAYLARDIVLDGRPARIVTLHSATRFAGRPFFVGLHFPDLGATSLGKTRLSIYAATETAQARAEIERVLLTVRPR